MNSTICWQEVIELIVSLICLTVVEVLIVVWQPVQQMTVEQLKNYALWMAVPFLLMTAIVKGSKWVFDYIRGLIPIPNKVSDNTSPADAPK